MKKILFVLGPYRTQKSPNGICVKHILEKMSTDIDFDVLSLEYTDYDDTDKEFSVKSDDKSSAWAPIIYPIRDTQAVKLLYNRLQRIHMQRNYDTIVAISNPPEAVEAVAKLRKRNKFQFIIYEIDSASNRYKQPKKLLQKLLMYKAFFWEKSVYKLADTIIHMVSHKRHYSNRCFKRFINKVVYLDIPGLVIPRYNYVENENNLNSFLYAGKFYPELRNPVYMLNCMSELFLKNNSYCMDIYSSTMESVVRGIIDSFGIKNIHYIESIPQTELDQKMGNYGVLISIGNRNSDFLPSKTINYLAMNKKVIHFYSDDSDVSIPYLSRYKNCLLIREDTDILEAVSKIEDFLRKESVYYSWNDITEMYIENTPQYTSDKLCEIIIS